MRVTKRFLTIFEMLIVMTLLMIAIGVVGINVARTVHEQRFRSEADLFVDQLRLAQNLMLMCGANVTVVVTGAEKSLESVLKFESNIPKEQAALLPKSALKFSHIHALNFEDQLKFSKTPNTQQQEIIFFSNGAVMSKGVMRIASSNRQAREGQVFERYIALSGHPTQINSFHHSEEAEISLKKNDAFIKTLTHQTFEELREKVQPSAK